MPILTENFPELDSQESQIASYTVPGFRGKLNILLTEQNAKFEGWAVVDDRQSALWSPDQSVAPPVTAQMSAGRSGGGVSQTQAMGA